MRSDKIFSTPTAAPIHWCRSLRCCATQGDASVIAATKYIRFDYPALMPAALMIGHHFSISSFCNFPSASGDC